MPGRRSASCCEQCCTTRRSLVWLDAPRTRAGHPNENLARELLELFSLGIGNYAEADVKQAARGTVGLADRRSGGPVDRVAP